MNYFIIKHIIKYIIKYNIIKLNGKNINSYIYYHYYFINFKIEYRMINK